MAAVERMRQDVKITVGRVRVAEDRESCALKNSGYIQRIRVKVVSKNGEFRYFSI